jgi:hypothetical protein
MKFGSRLQVARILPVPAVLGETDSVPLKDD